MALGEYASVQAQNDLVHAEMARRAASGGIRCDRCGSRLTWSAQLIGVGAG
ncbi:MAG: hypothetical protein WCF33_21940 [Pseudonocardiaceae bacterium]